MTLYEQISIIIFLGMFSLLVKDSIESARQRIFFREGYEEEKRRRREYRTNKLSRVVNLREAVIHLFNKLDTRLDRIDHDHQQLKTRLSWSKKREKKDLKHETKLSTKTKVLKFKKRK